MRLVADGDDKGKDGLLISFELSVVSFESKQIPSGNDRKKSNSNGKDARAS